MPRDGSGIYTSPQPDVVTNTTISSTAYNSNVNDVEADLNYPRPIVAGGTGSGTVAGAQTNLQIVPSTGGTFTGNIVVSKVSPVIAVNKTAANQDASFYGALNSTNRWGVALGDSVAEGGSNAGSNFSIYRYNDDGALLPSAFYIKRDTGNVGIGTAAPNRKLEVTGTIGVLEAAANTGIVLKNTASGGRDYQVLSCATGGIVGSGFVIFDNTSALTRFAINGSGFVGIGTSNPAIPLDVQVGANMHAGFVNNNGICLAAFTDGFGGWSGLNINQTISVAPLGGGVTITGTLGVTSAVQFSGQITGLSQYNTLGPNDASGVNTQLRLFGGSASGGGGRLDFGKNNTTHHIIGQESCIFGNASSDLMFYSAGNGRVPIRISHASDLMYFYPGATNAQVRTPHILPDVDNVSQCGIGSNRWTQVWAINGTIQTSDENEKDEIIDSDLGLAFINAVRPIAYRERTDGPEKPAGPFRYGVSAQQVQHVLGDKPFAGLVQDEISGIYGTSYTSFIAPLIKAVHELTARIEALEGAEAR